MLSVFFFFVYKNNYWQKLFVAARPFESDWRPKQFHLWCSPACLAAWILSELQKSIWWVTKSSAEGGAQMPYIAQRTGASASLQRCSSKQSNDKGSGWRQERDTVGWKGGWKDVGFCLESWGFAEWKYHQGKKNVDWGSGAAEDLAVPSCFTSCDQPWHVNNG